MTDFLFQVAGESWSIFKEASLFLLVGFAVAGVLAVLVPSRLSRRLVEVVLRQDADAVLTRCVVSPRCCSELEAHDA